MVPIGRLYCRSETHVGPTALRAVARHRARAVAGRLAVSAHEPQTPNHPQSQGWALAEAKPPNVISGGYVFPAGRAIAWVRLTAGAPGALRGQGPVSRRAVSHSGRKWPEFGGWRGRNAESDDHRRNKANYANYSDSGQGSASLRRRVVSRDRREVQPTRCQMTARCAPRCDRRKTEGGRFELPVRQ